MNKRVSQCGWDYITPSPIGNCYGREYDEGSFIHGTTNVQADGITMETGKAEGN